MSKTIKSISVVLGLTIHKSKILLCKRNERELPDIDQMWEVPGGKPEKNESGKETAVRELFEETGYKVIAESFIPFPYIVTRKYQDFDLHVNVICVLCRLDEKYNKEHTEDKKILEVKWFDFKDLNLMNVIAGSREFIAWSVPSIAKEKNILNSIRHISNIVFENMEPTRNTYKYYFIQCEYEPFSLIPYKIYKMWGRITSKYTDLIVLLLEGESFNNPKKTKIESYENFELFSKGLTKIMNKRVNNKYYIIDFSENFPDKIWLQEHQELLIQSKYPSQLNLDIFL